MRHLAALISPGHPPPPSPRRQGVVPSSAACRAERIRSRRAFRRWSSSDVPSLRLPQSWALRTPLVASRSGPRDWTGLSTGSSQRVPRTLCGVGSNVGETVSRRRHRGKVAEAGPGNGWGPRDPWPFIDFMQAALYHPSDGYYATRVPRSRKPLPDVSVAHPLVRPSRRPRAPTDVAGDR